MIAVGPDQQPALYPIAGGNPQPIAALGNDLMPIVWGETSEVLFARPRALGRLAPVFRIDRTTGRRQRVGEFGPADPRGSPLVIHTYPDRQGPVYRSCSGINQS